MGAIRATVVALGVVLAATACGQETTSAPAPAAAGQAAMPVIEVYRSASCDCCGRYEDYLKGEGFEVRSVVREDIASLKESLGVLPEMGSCHTSLVEGYFVEGHVPAEAISELLEERPDVDGIALPGMPPGSPGMGGEKDGPWVVYAISDGEATEFARR